MTYIDTLAKTHNLSNAEDFVAAANKLYRHMHGLSPVQNCTFCGIEHDSGTALCDSCDKINSDRD